MDKTPFKLSRQRDAWGPIRGYLYQIDLTVLRWLQLGKTESLILECGEDIDRVQQLLSDPTAETRLLEQVKVRQPRLTLQSAIAREALASFCEHKANNPTSSLRFRFLTTSQPGNESTAIPNLEAGRSGVRVWEAIRKGDIDGDSGGRSAAAILAYLRNKRRPRSVNEGTWNHFLTFTQQVSTGEMLVFIKEFEWAVAAPSPSDLANQVQGELVASKRAGTPQEATRKQEHLVDCPRERYTMTDAACGVGVFPAEGLGVFGIGVDIAAH